MHAWFNENTNFLIGINCVGFLTHMPLRIAYGSFKCACTNCDPGRICRIIVPETVYDMLY